MRRLVFNIALAFSLLLFAGCAGMLGGATRTTVPESQLPPAGIAAFRQSRPDAHIDRIVGVFSNAPPLYQLYYHEDHAKADEAEYRYSDYGRLGETLLPVKARAGFKRLHPDGIIERVEWFADLEKQTSFYRLTFRSGSAPSRREFFRPDGQTFTALESRERT